MENGFDTDFLHDAMKEVCSTLVDEDVKRSCTKFAQELATALNSTTPTTQAPVLTETTSKQRQELQRLYEEFDAVSSVVSHLRTIVPDTNSTNLQKSLEKLMQQTEEEELPQQDHDDSMEIQASEEQHQSHLTEALTKLKSELTTVNLMDVRSRSAVEDLEKMVMAMEDKRQRTPSPLRTPRASINLTPQSTKHLRFFAKDVNLD